MNKSTITILCSGVAMGVYIPALAVRHQLENLDTPSEVVVLESLISEEKRNKINDTKKIFHKNFRIAKKGHEMARDITSSLNPEIKSELFEKWKSENRRYFIVFSGFWMPLLLEFMDFVHPHEVYADLVIVDSEISPSWKSFKGDYPDSFKTIRLFKSEENKIVQKIFTPKEPLLPFAERENRLVIHGGGWGMGTYESHIPELNEHGIDLNIMVYFHEDYKSSKNINRYFMVDPTWQPWDTDKTGRAEFPPFSEIYENQSENYKNRDEYHELFYVIAKSKGIISKPGGSTLVDSLASATPIIFLDPLSGHEEKNAKMWIDLGLGISYE
ncbi:MAG TPA: UDP-glucuronosyltransferase, partial [Clostridia bacterium]